MYILTLFFRTGRRAKLIAAMVAFSVFLALTAACGGSAVAVIDHSAAISPDNSLIAEVQVTLSREARVFIEYDNPDAGKFRTALSEPATAHTIPVVRLRPESTYAYTIGTQDAGGAETLGPSGEFTTGRLPPRLDIQETWVSGRSTQPLIVTDYRVGDEVYYVFWDETGNIVWYYIIPPVIELDNISSPNTIQQKPNGNLLYVRYKCCIIEITPLGEMVDRIAAGDAAGIPHHDFLMLEDGRILYPSDTHITLDESANGGAPDTPVVVDTLNIWNPETGIIEQVWDSRDFWDISDPDQRGLWPLRSGHYRWTHINSVSFGRRGNFILSSRNRHQVFSLSPDFQSIEWQLGGPDSDYAFPDPNDRFYGQHTAKELPDGNILVFDNGVNRPDAEGGLYSRALELRLDHDTRTAVKVWEYRSATNPFSRIVSSAFRLDNGNTLVNFGAKPSVILGPLTFVETGPQGNDVFRVETFQPDFTPGEYNLRYRAYAGITAIMGETMLRPPVARPVTGEYAYKVWLRQIHDTYAARDSSQPAARGRFDIYFDGDRVIYLKEQCAAEDIADRFLLHLFPANPNDLPDDRREYGFDNLDFHFRILGVMWEGKCIATANLPDYEIARIRTGQYIPGEDQKLWQAEFPATQ